MSLDAGSTVSLKTVSIGSKVRIVSIDLPASDQDFLMRLGIVPGVEIEFIRKGPLNGPVIYRVQGGEIALRTETAAMIRVEPLSSAGANSQ